MSLAGEALPPHQEVTRTALIIDSDEALRERLLPAIRRALDAGENVLMVVPPDTERVVRASLGDQAADLARSDTRLFYQRLRFTFQTFRRYLEQQHAAGQRVYIVAEPDIPSSGSKQRRIGLRLICRMRPCVAKLSLVMAARSHAYVTAGAIPLW